MEGVDAELVQQQQAADGVADAGLWNRRYSARNHADSPEMHGGSGSSSSACGPSSLPGAQGDEPVIMDPSAATETGGDDKPAAATCSGTTATTDTVATAQEQVEATSASQPSTSEPQVPMPTWTPMAPVASPPGTPATCPPSALTVELPSPPTQSIDILPPGHGMNVLAPGQGNDVLLAGPGINVLLAGEGINEQPAAAQAVGGLTGALQTQALPSSAAASHGAVSAVAKVEDAPARAGAEGRLDSAAAAAGDEPDNLAAVLQGTHGNNGVASGLHVMDSGQAAGFDTDDAAAAVCGPGHAGLDPLPTQPAARACTQPLSTPTGEAVPITLAEIHAVVWRSNLCKFFVRNRWCRYGNNCRNYHPTAGEFAVAEARRAVAAAPAVATGPVSPTSSATATSVIAPIGAVVAAPGTSVVRHAVAADVPEAIKLQQLVQARQFASAAVAAATSALAQGAAVAPRPPDALSPTIMPAEPRHTFNGDVHVETFTTPQGVLMAKIGEHRAVPVRPGQGACIQFMKSGSCQWGRNCRHHHPLEKVKEEVRKLQRVSGAGQPHGAGAGGVGVLAAPAAVAPSREDSWRRPEQQQQQQTQQVGDGVTFASGQSGGGGAEAGSASDMDGAAPSSPARTAGNYIIQYDSVHGRAYVQTPTGWKLPVNPKRPACSNLLATGQCRYGMRCKYNHTSQMLVAWDLKRQHRQQGTQGDAAGQAAAAAGAGEGPQQDEGASKQYSAASSATTAREAATAAISASTTADHAAAPTVESLAAAVSKIWPPTKHSNPEVWAAHNLVLYLVLQAGHFEHQRSVGGSAAPLHLDALLANTAKLGSVQVKESHVKESSVLLARIGAELGMRWRKEQRQGVPQRMAQYEVKLGLLLRGWRDLEAVVEAHKKPNSPEVWLHLRVRALLELAKGIRGSGPAASQSHTEAVSQQAPQSDATLSTSWTTLDDPSGWPSLAEPTADVATSRASPGHAAPGPPPSVPSSAYPHPSAAAAPAPTPAPGPSQQLHSSTPAAQAAVPQAVQPPAAAAATTTPPTTTARTAGAITAAAVAAEPRPGLYEVSLTEASWTLHSERLAGPPSPSSSGVSSHDYSLRQLLPLLPAGLAAHVAPFFTVTGSDGCGLVTSISIPASGPPMVRFFSTNPNSGTGSSNSNSTSGSAYSGRLLLEGVEAPLEEALARLGACGQLLMQHQHDSSSGLDTDGTPGSDGWFWDPSTPTPDPFRGADALLVPGTLHRALASRDAMGAVTCLTYRIGRQPSPAPRLQPSPNVLPVALLADLLHAVAKGPEAAAGSLAAAGVAAGRGKGSAPGLLLLGPPGSGKTTLLRCLTHAAARYLGLTVLVLDNSWEMGGLPIGRTGAAATGSDSACAAWVGADLGPGTQRVCFHHLVRQQQQHGGGAATSAMVQAVSGALALHAPDVVVVDDLKSEQEAGIAMELASRGVVVLAAAPVRDLRALLHHPQLSAVAGVLSGVQAATAPARFAAGLAGPALAPQQLQPPSFCSAVELLHPMHAAARGIAVTGAHEPSPAGPALRVHADLCAAVASVSAGDLVAGAQLRFAQGGKLLVHAV